MKGRIYSVNENNEIMAEATFIYKENGEVNINRTYVNPVLRGQGEAGKICRLCEYLRENSLRLQHHVHMQMHAEQVLISGYNIRRFDGGVTA